MWNRPSSEFKVLIELFRGSLTTGCTHTVNKRNCWCGQWCQVLQSDTFQTPTIWSAIQRCGANHRENLRCDKIIPRFCYGRMINWSKTSFMNYSHDLLNPFKSLEKKGFWTHLAWARLDTTFEVREEKKWLKSAGPALVSNVSRTITAGACSPTATPSRICLATFSAIAILLSLKNLKPNTRSSE